MFWRKWSTGSLVNDMPGASSSGSVVNPEMRLDQKNDVYQLQSHEPCPWLLIDTIFHIAHILDSDWQSKKMYEQLVRMELLSEGGEVNTEPVERKDFGKEILSRTAFIPQFKTRLVIDLLFWWAEETQRLKKLVAERDELRALSKSNPGTTDERGFTVELLLAQVIRRIGTLPGDRINDEDEIPMSRPGAVHEQTDQPPAYQR